MGHIYAPIRSPRHPSLDGLVLFELAYPDGGSLYLAIRYSAFQNNEVEGDHIYLDGLEAAKSELEEAFDIEPEEWRSLTPDEANVVDASIG